MSFLLNPFVYGAQTLYTFQGTLGIGGTSFYYDGSDQETTRYTNISYTGYGGVTGEFGDSAFIGSLSPSSYGTNNVTSLYVELYDYYDARGGSTSFTYFNVQVGPDTSPLLFPTLNDYPLTAAAGGGYIDTLRVQMPRNLLDIKFQALTPTLRFALRTDLIETVGSGTITVPTGATRAIVYVLGGGGGGARVASGVTRRGGGNAGIAVSNISVPSAQWGTSLSYTVGQGGAGRTSTTGSGTAGTASSVTHAGLGLSMTANGGAGGTTTAAGAGGTASGGNVSNTTGSTGLTTVPTSNGADGRQVPNDNAFTGAHQGGGGGSGANGNSGLSGYVAIVWY